MTLNTSVAETLGLLTEQCYPRVITIVSTGLCQIPWVLHAISSWTVDT